MEVTPVSVAVVGGSGDTEFELSFSPQDVRGSYRLTVGPDITDVAGNAMDQDNDGSNGEPSDAYTGTVDFEQTVRTDIGVEPDLYVENFDGWAPVPTYWGFVTEDDGWVGTTGADGPHGRVQREFLSEPKGADGSGPVECERTHRSIPRLLGEGK